MVNIKFSTRYLVDLLFSRQITSSRRIRTNRKRLAIPRDSLPSDGEVFTINILERASGSLLFFPAQGRRRSERSLSPQPRGTPPLSGRLRPATYFPVSAGKAPGARSQAICDRQPIREGIVATASTPSLSRVLMQFTIEYQFS